MTQALIVGGGIGGLTTALWFHRVGVAVTVFEAVPEVKPLGVGINLLPHSTKVLHQRGLQNRLEATAILTRELRYHSKDGKTIWVEPRGRFAGYQTPQYSIHRGRLQMLLLDAVKNTIGAQQVLTAHRFVGCEQSEAGGVVAHFTRSQAGEEQVSVRGDVLIGADGLHSAVCALFYPHEGPPQFSGQMLWRGAVETEPFLGGDAMVMMGTNDLKAVIYPISQESAVRGRSLVNWVAERRIGKDNPRAKESWNKQGHKADFVSYFHNWRFSWIDVPKLFTETDEVFEFPMVDRDPVAQWSTNAVQAPVVKCTPVSRKPNSKRSLKHTSAWPDSIVRQSTADAAVGYQVAIQNGLNFADTQLAIGDSAQGTVSLVHLSTSNRSVVALHVYLAG